MNKSILIIIIFFGLVSCNKKSEKSDAYGNFEATDIIISSEVNGKILELNLEEGQLLAKDEIIGLIDTSILYLQKKQLIAQKSAISSQFSGIIAQVNVYEEQKRVLEKEKDRIEKLLKDSAATQQQLDNVEGQISVLEKQIAMVKTQNSALFSQIDAYNLQIEQVDIQIQKSVIKSPEEATVLEKYVEKNEMATLGKPLYKLANMTDMKLTVYIDGSQLSTIKSGQKVQVLIDKNEDELSDLEGEIIQISDEAEFTPKIIQTKKERVNLVYAIKILVKNDGTLKIGMPGEVNF
jgi:HlyD family secretion protein